ncbi:bleomycin resistance protein [Massilia eurypsychrophila]|uniref:Bleomycin resistance protein n=1 Tax=Massilia eurypsychrophila TaxID=1485217 RepID=A0A2G8TEJ5_9BURK|nr:VOC family protein [Massilia eurypsychrophila]PIL44379.1 bleomycin resistance protein [Massilia eurypsychrophila]
MAIELDHFIVSCRNRGASAKLLAELLGVPWEETSFAVFSPVYINDGLTLDFQQTEEAYPIAHYCFRVSQHEFDAILARIQAAGIAYRSNVRGPVDMKINKDYGGDMIYWNEPDGHQWEILTVSYARQAGPAIEASRTKS